MKKIFILPIVVTLFGFCNGVVARQSGTNIPSRMPTKKEFREATAPEYIREKYLESECLGRLIFDHNGEIEWPTSHRHQSGVTLKSRKFSENIYQQGDQIEINNMLIAVIGPINKNLIESLQSELPDNMIVRLTESLKKAELYLDKSIKTGATDRKSRYARSEIEDNIQTLKKSIAQLGAENEIFKPGVLNSLGYWHSTQDSNENLSSIYRAYIFGKEYAYVFESTEDFSTEADKEAHKRRFMKILGSFKERKKNQIPEERGLCIPYGFLPDDGKTASNIQQSIRWSDAPGVLYTIHTGNVDSENMQSPTIEAISSAAIGLMGSADEARVKPFVSQRIGPHSVKIGALTAQQGGVALKVSEAGKAPYEAYSIFTGYGGWLGTFALPYISVEMTTRTMAEAPELKANPPPFKQSLDRLNTLLKSTRLRPTTPAMPELANIQGEK